MDGRFERLVHDSPAIAFVREPAGAFAFVSDGVTRALGWSPQALVTDPGFWAERIHPDDKARVVDQFARIHETGHCASEYRLRHADGDYRWMREEMRADGAGELIGHWTDITDSRHAEEALRDNERRFKDFAESVSDWFWETDSRHRFTAFSGLSKHDVAWFTKASIGKTRFDARLRDDRDDRKWDLHRADLGARRSFRNFVFPIAAEDGSTRHIRVGGRPMFSEAGDFRGYRGTATDVTAVVEAEQRATAARALLWDTIESIPDALAVYDADDKLILYNETFRQGVLRGIGDTIEAGVTFEALLRLAVARGQPAADVVEVDAKLIPFGFHPLVQRPRIDEFLLAVVLRQSPLRQPFSDGLLVLRMNVLQVSNVGDHCHSGVRQRQHIRLGLPQHGQLTGRLVAVLVGRNLHEVERQLGLVPNRTPALNQRQHFVFVQ